MPLRDSQQYGSHPYDHDATTPSPELAIATAALQQQQQQQQQQQPQQQQQRPHSHQPAYVAASRPSSSDITLTFNTASSSSLSHALDMNCTSKPLPQSYHAGEEYAKLDSAYGSADSHAGASKVVRGGGSKAGGARGDVWLSSKQLLPSEESVVQNQWQPSEVSINESIDEYLSSSLSKGSWQSTLDTSTNATNQPDSLWSGFRTTSSPSSLANNVFLNESHREGGISYSRSPIVSDPSLSPYSFSALNSMGRIQESSSTEFQSVSRLTASLSAELAGLGLDVSDFYPTSNLPLHDAMMGDLRSGVMQASLSSSSSIATHPQPKHFAEQGDMSFLSQATSSLDSSGFDDSLLSSGTNAQSSTRWIHGKDTPPSSPAPSFAARMRPSPMQKQNSGGLSAAMHPSASSPYFRTDEFGVKRKTSRQQSITDKTRTWPRTLHQMESTTGSTSFPMYQSSSENIGNIPNSSSTGDHRLRRRLSLTSAQSLQERRSKRSHRGLVGDTSLEIATGGIGSSGSKRSNDSIRSDKGPSRSIRSNAEVIEKRRGKRISASFSSDLNARQWHQDEQHQFDQVTDALETLRTFLRQRERSSSQVSRPSSKSTSYAGGSIGSHTIGPLGEHMPTVFDAPSNPDTMRAATTQKTLRHPPPGPLPPRGSIYASPNSSPSISQVQDTGDGDGAEVERIAALEALAKRVRQMKNDNQRLLEEL
ncbi:hypothetical protein CBS101457_001692 [Exobasidium rhododendri]|nr:hypothetical protein CBS101457_001692 [Exobasidium rhododendri]